MVIEDCKKINDSLSIKFVNGQVTRFSLFWLRDHSTDGQSLNKITLQRDVETFALPASPGIKDFQVIENGHKLLVKWLSEDVISEYDAKFLYAIAFDELKEPVYQLWNTDLQDDISDFNFSQVTSSGDKFLPVIDAIEKHGIVTFSDMPTDMGATKKLLEQVGYIRETVFGGLWNFSNNEAHSDSAYTNVGIGLHTDGTYAIDPPGLQLLHCLAFDGQGGFNQFSDGFKVAQTIKDENPRAFDILTQIKVPAHYMEDGIQLRAKHEVISEDEAGHFQQICFNNFDRSPFMLSENDQQEFYNAYGLFQKLINDPAYQITFQLKPGRAVWFDNWRVLHARSGFTGFRHLAGGYTNREDYLSKKFTLRGESPWNE
jgi:trimethyllysine dioxygenase